MFLRWKKKKRNMKRANATVRLTLSPVIVESIWEEGKTKQRVLKHLGGIREEHIPHPNPRRDFWNKVNMNLRSIEISPQQRALFSKQIEDVVPKPSSD